MGMGEKQYEKFYTSHYSDGTAIFCYDPDGMKVEFHLKS